MEKRTLLALLLIMAIFWISNEFIWKKSAPAQDPPDVSESTVLPASKETAPDVTPSNISGSLPETTQSRTDYEIRDDLVLENEHIRLVLSNLGAVITSIQLKNYHLYDPAQYLELLPPDQTMLNIELENNEGRIINLANQVFQYDIITAGQSISFTWFSDSGHFTKTFTLQDGYRLALENRSTGLEFLSAYRLSMDGGIADTEEFIIKHPKEKLRDYKIYSEINNDISKFPLSKLKDKNETLGKVDWAAIRSKYFVLGIYPVDLIDINKLITFNNANSPALQLGINVNRSKIENSFALYLGPLLKERLDAFNPAFGKVMEGPFLEILRPISNLFSWLFRVLKNVIPNYGIIIILVSILLKFLFYPLTHKSFESTHKMQKVTPMMKEIQQKYKNDPRTMNEELRKLYKEHGVSPLGGCLPILLQMPIIFAIYPVIRYSIDMRQSGFLWLPDLSEPDQLMILPIVMAIFMFIQQKLMTPSREKIAGMDEKQQAAQQSQKMMMYLMPVLMFFIFKSLSSGLVLYWTVFSVIGTIQQYFIKKKFD